MTYLFKGLLKMVLIILITPVLAIAVMIESFIYFGGGPAPVCIDRLAQWLARL